MSNIRDTFETEKTLDLLKKYALKGCSVVPCDNDFEIIDGRGCSAGRITIYPGTIRYADLNNGRVYHADINDHRVGYGKRSELPEIPSDLGVDISSVAARLRTGDCGKIANPVYSNILEKILPRGGTLEQLKIVDQMSSITTFQGMLNLIFFKRKDLSLIDIGTGFGEFPLGLSRRKRQLGIASIKATDLHVELMGPKLNKLKGAGIIVEQLDITGDVPEGCYDIATLNAPQVMGEGGFAYKAVPNAIKMLKTPGLLLLRLNERGDDYYADDEINLSLGGQVGVKVMELKGLPPSKYAKSFDGKGSSPIFVIVKI